MIDWDCPWCGEEMTNPFTGRDVRSAGEYDLALEAHAPECEEMQAEQAVDWANQGVEM